MIRVGLDRDDDDGISGGAYQSEQVYEIEVEVTDPKIHKVDNKPDHVTYNVSSSSSYPSWKDRIYNVTRRYNDFVWLKNQLDREIRDNDSPLPVRPLPPLPATESIIGWFMGDRFQPEFIEKRRQDLHEWINVAANHDVTRESKALLNFLQSDDFEAVQNYFSL
jgi:PX domain